MINNPFEVKSDSFYFVGNEFIMHIKAEYAYDEYNDWIRIYIYIKFLKNFIKDNK